MEKISKWFVFIASILLTTIIIVNNINQLLYIETTERQIIGFSVIAVVVIGYVFLNHKQMGFSRIAKH